LWRCTLNVFIHSSIKKNLLKFVPFLGNCEWCWMGVQTSL
jgi:hypothetical protein